MDVCSSPGGVSASARQPPAQNDAEAQPKEAAGVGPARRGGAAVRLVLDGITESARTLETPTESMEGVVSPSDGEGHASAQFGPQGGNKEKEAQQSGAGTETTGAEVDVSEWTLEDWRKDHKKAPEDGNYRTGEGWFRPNRFVISDEVVPVKMGLLNVAPDIGKWRDISLHDRATMIKEHVRKMPRQTYCTFLYDMKSRPTS